ncbi:hypothetical protein [Kitasatospora indigofera]|uniref:hypothetical protein n=1 Tax=Kitasatospora indigofera TaxID=67307 RepID=UPI00167CBEE5|nr:hypothetical protein [Kitasatospora indigofera]
MNQVIDLDRAALEVTGRRLTWQRQGLAAGVVTWRDGAAPWPQRLETDRSSVTEPDSIGIVLTGPDDAELSVVLFRGGWADVDFMASADDAGVLPASDMDSAQAFGDLLDHCVARVFGSK